MFDWKYYLDHYKDLRENGIISEKQAFDHFTKHGRNEGRICCTIPSDFDWKFYTKNYKDLSHIPNKVIAYEHYFYHGKQENRIINKFQSSFLDLKNLLNHLNLCNIVISPGLQSFSRIINIYKLTSNYDRQKDTIFFGVYSMEDVKKINNHLGHKYIMFGGNDCNLNSTHRSNIFKSINFDTNLSFISISSDIYTRLIELKKKKIFSNTIYNSNLNLLDKSIWKKINIVDNNVYVYDGVMKKTEVYSSELCDNIIKILQKKYKNKINFIRTSDFKDFISPEDLFSIYKKCFIGIRLTYHDGNANTVMEFKECGLPIIHNHSEYGIKWKDQNNVVKIIEDSYKKHLVSVIIPIGDNLKLLRENVNSILKQTYRLFEILIIKNCSSNFNLETQKQFEQLDDRIQIINLDEKLENVDLVFNYGILNSNGNFLAFSTGTSIWFDNKLEQQINYLKENNKSICFSNLNKPNETKILEKPNEIVIENQTEIKNELIFKNAVIKKTIEHNNISKIENIVRQQKLKVLIFQGINAYRCYKYTKLLHQMGYVVDCCYSYQDFSFHHGKDVLDTKHINNLFKLRNYDQYKSIYKNYDILFCIDIVDPSSGCAIQVGYNNFKNNIKTIHLIGDLFLFQKPKTHNFCKIENEVLSNINPSLVVFSGNFLKERAANIFPKLTQSSVILNTPLKEHIYNEKNCKQHNFEKIKLVISTNFCSIKKDNHRNMNEIFNLLTKDNRIEIYIYYTKNSEPFIKEYYHKDNIHFMGTVELDKMIETFSNYDFGVIYYEEIYSDNHYIDISEPNKMYEYYFSKLPILCNKSKSFNKNIIENNIGVSLDLRKEHKLYEKLKSFVTNYKFNEGIFYEFDHKFYKDIIQKIIINYRK